MRPPATRASLFFLLLSLVAAGPARAVEISGVEFPLGELSFADQVVSSTLGPGSTLQTDPTAALGAPDTPGIPYTMGNQGVLTVEFVDNLLVDQDVVEGGLDLFVFELGATGGGVTENFRIEISKDDVDYIDLGEFQGETLGVDIAPFITPGDQFRFVRLTDLLPNNTGSPYAGADILAIGAIGSVAIPEPQTLLLALVVGGVAGGGRPGRRRR